MSEEEKSPLNGYWRNLLQEQNPAKNGIDIRINLVSKQITMALYLNLEMLKTQRRKVNSNGVRSMIKPLFSNGQNGNS